MPFLRVFLDSFEVSSFINSWNSIKQTIERNTVVDKSNISIIDSMKTKFTATVTNQNSTKSFHSFLVSDGNSERVDSILFAFDDKLGPNKSHIGDFCCSSYPKLVTWFRWIVKNKRSCFMVIYSLSLKIFGIASMSNFSKSKTSDIFCRKSVFDKIFMRLISSPSKGNDCFRIEENSDITSDT